VEERDFVSMNYRAGFQSESLCAENIFFLSSGRPTERSRRRFSPLAAIIPSREFHWRVASIPAIPRRSHNSFHYWDSFQESTLEIGIVPRNPQEDRFALLVSFRP
jgi:hypothetical protein